MRKSLLYKAGHVDKGVFRDDVLHLLADSWKRSVRGCPKNHLKGQCACGGWLFWWGFFSPFPKPPFCM